ncbi:S-adenosyl-L-methionine-dependent methyltransferase superfamily protein [Trifolium repens]|nr:S-adenosyl-L-methionine-dependent methyltransferase superfamily protein [Trifolium repens]
MLPELFDHQDQNVRASSKGLTLELCRWIEKKELEAEVVNVTGTAKPSRKIRSEQDKEPEQETISEVVGPGPAEESGADAPQEIDEYELVDPVDILTPLEKSEFWDGVKATKWLERKEAVGELTKLASTKRISPGDFSEVCRTLKKALLCHYPLKLSCSIMHRSISLNSHFMFSKLQAFEPPLDMTPLRITCSVSNQHGCVEGSNDSYRSSVLAYPDEVQCIIRNIVRDWAVEGLKERDQCYKPILEELSIYFLIAV